MRALIGLTLLVGGALSGLEHVTQHNPALLVPFWTSVGLSDSAVPAANPSEPVKPATDNSVVQTLAVADTAQQPNATQPNAIQLNAGQSTPPVSAAPAPPKTADVVVAPVKRVRPVTPPAEPAAVTAPEVKTAATVAAAKTAKTFAGRSALGGPVPAATPVAPVAAIKTVAKASKQAAAKTAPAVAIQKRPGFKLTCTAAQKLDVEKQRCVAIKGKLATATAKPKA